MFKGKHETVHLRSVRQKRRRRMHAEHKGVIAEVYTRCGKWVSNRLAARADRISGAVCDACKAVS